MDYHNEASQPFTERLMLGSRFLLVPMYLGLIIAMMAYDYAFMHDLFNLVQGIWTADNLKEFLLIGVLGLLDAAMVANLIIMIMIGSQSIFVNEINPPKGQKVPRFLKGLTSGILKVKMGSSLVSVSSVHLLAAFMQTQHHDWGDLGKKVVIHIIFIISAYIFTLMEVKLHPPVAHTEEAH